MGLRTPDEQAAMPTELDIAIFGWGSLVWDPRELPHDGRWRRRSHGWPGGRHRVRLLPVRDGDERVAVAVHDDPSWAPFTFLYGYDRNTGWSDYVTWLADLRRGASLRSGEVPATFLLAWVDGELVGRTSIRHQLHGYLETYGGHIGYGVVRSHRRRGYATETLRQSLVIARSVGVIEVLVTCDDGNVGSARTIESCGGVLESVVEQPDGPSKRRYWIA